jgi:hypothetical protein
MDIIAAYREAGTYRGAALVTGPTPASSPQRSRRGVRRGLPPAARQPCPIRGANQAAALKPAPPGLKSLPSGLQSWPGFNAG